MFHEVVVRPEPPGQYTAQVWGNPEIRATAGSEAEAVEQVKRLLADWLATAKWVRVDVPTPGYTHPALKFAGHADPNDPLEQEYLAEIARYRREVDERDQEDEQSCPSDSSSTPTT